MNIKFVADPYGIHQYHEKVYQGSCAVSRELFARHKERIENEKIYNWQKSNTHITIEVLA